MEEFHAAVAQNRKIDIVDIHAAWKSYPPSDPLSRKFHPEPPDAALLQAGFNAEKNALQAAVRQSMADAESTFVAALKANPNVQTYNRLGILYARRGRLDEAQKMFTQALALASSQPALLNNLANTYCLKGADTLSTAMYRKAISADPAQIEKIADLLWWEEELCP